MMSKRTPREQACIDAPAVSLQIVFMPNQNDSKDQIRQQMLARNDPSAAEPAQKPQVARKPYQFLMIPVLREYITHEFAPERPLPFTYDLERVVDDFGAATV